MIEAGPDGAAPRDAPFDLRTGVGVAGCALALHVLVASNAIDWHAPRYVPTLLSQLALAVVALVAARGAIRARLGLRMPRPRFVLAAVLIGATAWNAHGWTNTWAVDVFGRPTPGLALDTSLAFAILLVAVTPALCEELVFRGVLARALATRWSWAAAIGASALLFALYHHSPYNLVPPLLDGAMGAYLTLRARSLVPAMLMHFLHNLAIVLRDHGAPLDFWRWFYLHRSATLGACALATFTGLWIAWRGEPG